MNRNIVIGFFAIYPLVMLTTVIIFQDVIPYIVQENNFLSVYWWSVALLPCIVIWFVFLGGNIFNKNLSKRKKFWWSLGLIIFSFYAMPVYWWFCVHKAANQSLKGGVSGSGALS